MKSRRNFSRSSFGLSFVGVPLIVFIATVIRAHPEKIATMRKTEVNAMHHRHHHHHHSHRLHHLLRYINQASATSYYTKQMQPLIVSTASTFIDLSRLSKSSSKRWPSRFRNDEEWKFGLATTTDTIDNESTTLTKSNSSNARNVTPHTQSQQQQQQDHFVSNYIPRHSLWHRLYDDYNFKGYGISVYKSLMMFRQAGIGFKIPLINNWDWWDSNPMLPSLGLMICFYYPLNISMCLTSSMRLDVVKCWFYKVLWILQACLLRFLHHVWSAVWIILSLLSYPIQQKWRPVPFHLEERSKQAMANSQELQPLYKSEIQERLGVSYWYRYRPGLGRDSRVSVWHLYMPTMEVYSQLLTGSKETLWNSRWWKSHFASMGLDSAVSNGLFSATGVWSLSGFRFQKRRNSSKSTTVETTISSDETEDGSTIEYGPLSHLRNQDDEVVECMGPALPDSKATKVALSTILHDDKDRYGDDYIQQPSGINGGTIKITRGGSNATATNKGNDNSASSGNSL